MLRKLKQGREEGGGCVYWEGGTGAQHAIMARMVIREGLAEKGMFEVKPERRKKDRLGG